MKLNFRYSVLLVIVMCIVMSVMGCRKLSPEDLETQALAKQFMQAVYINNDSALAMTFVGPITTYGYVTPKMVDDIIATDTKDRCTTPPESLQVSALDIDMKVPELTASDGAKGITLRTGWKVSSTIRCAGQKDDLRVSIVELEKVNGKWGVGRVTWQTGMGGTYSGGLE
jgi:hypothetical protein